MIRHLILAAPLALGLASAQALAAGKAPPPAYAEYVAAVRKADAIRDPLQRCLAYPDLPGNQWAPGVAKARCVLFNTPPIYTLDGLEKALAQPGGVNAVDAKFAALLDAHFSVPGQRDQIFVGLGIFRDKDSAKAERIARAWLAASPDSPFARTALGRTLEGRGWEARGTGFVKDTPADKLRRMETYFVDAATQYVAALKTNPKLLPACEGMMAIGRQSSDDVQAWATKTCMDADPASYFFVDEMMNAAEPRWGGSTEQMRAVGAYAEARVKDNPVLAVFAFSHASYDIERADDKDAQVLSVLEPAAALVPNAGTCAASAAPTCARTTTGRRSYICRRRCASCRITPRNRAGARTCCSSLANRNGRGPTPNAPSHSSPTVPMRTGCSLTSCATP